MANTPSDLIAQRVRKLREGRGWKVADLAARCKEAGMPRLTVQALYKLETQRDRSDRAPRSVTVDELLVLAYVLDVAPVHLIAGLDDDTPLPVSPDWTVNAPGARKWVRGLVPLSGGDKKRYEANVPASEENTRWFIVNDVTSYEQLTQALEAIKAMVSLRRWQEQNEGDDS
jgi:transcriptional regulator with XRE-family HTH domain